MSRPTILTSELAQRFLKAIAAGCPIDAACRIAGIHISTFYAWRDKGRRGAEPYCQFVEAVTRSQAVAEENLVSKVANSEDWRAAGWLLERRFNERWANKQRVNILVEKQLEEITSGLQNKLSPLVYFQFVRALNDTFRDIS